MKNIKYIYIYIVYNIIKINKKNLYIFKLFNL